MADLWNENREQNSGEFKKYVFTKNNPSSTEDEWCKAMREVFPTMELLAFKKEIGKEGTPHYQGWFKLMDKMRLRAAKNKAKSEKLSCWIMCQQAKDTAKAIEYVEKNETKAGEVWYWPSKEKVQNEKVVKAGTRTDLMDAAQMIKEGKSLADVAEINPALYIRNHKGLAAYQNLITKHRTVETKCIIYWGESNSGKSYKAYEEAKKIDPDPYVVLQCDKKNIWFDGYEGQKAVIFDDWNGECELSFFKRLANWLPMRVPIKGSSVKFVATHIFITSNHDPVDWWKDEFTKNPEEQVAFERRVEITKMSRADNPTLQLIE